ncbi:MAG: hypothetical protein ACRD1U_17745 [Vicinamibacterales bacterium]
MRRGAAAASLTIIASVAGSACPARAQTLTLGANAIFYGDNTEFHNPFREGETIFGAAVRLDGRVEMNDSATLTLGVFGNQRFGSSDAFEMVRPIVALTVSGRRSTFVVGTLPSPFESRPLSAARASGPDLGGPHGLLPPLQVETLAFDRPYEAGLAWTFRGARFEHEMWLQWQRLNTREHRERLDAGGTASWRAAGPFSIPFQAHIVHEGGQLFASGPVRDSIAVASGIALSNKRALPSATSPSLVTTLELFGLWSRYTADREAPDPSRDGGAFFGRASASLRGWRAHLIAWRGDDFIKDEGDPNYLSIRRDGSRYRGVRDYAESGLTRTFQLAPGAALQASFRFHRIERHYEYSYRIVAVADIRVRP